MFYSIHIVRKLNSEHDPAVCSVVNIVESVATRLNIPLVGVTGIESHTLVIAIGGDGTMLQAMRFAAHYDATALGINLGRVGFLSDINVKQKNRNRIDERELSQTVERVLTPGNTVTEYRTALVTSVDDTAISCNEVSVAAKFSDTVITYHLKVGNVSAGVHRANSILVSTPTGSTAYSLSAGGALMMPHIDAIQIVPVAPITMTSRPLIVAPDSIIRLEVISNGISVRGDGQLIDDVDHQISRSSPYVISIRQYLRKVRVIHLKEWNFFDVLTEKLGWIKQTAN